MNYITDKEIWKDVRNFEGYYEVSNLGGLRRKSRYITDKNGVTRFWKGKVLKLHENIDGYYRCILSKEGKVTHDSIHRLVAESFIDNPNNYPVINHKDEDPSNNCVENLEWCTIEYNNAYGTRIKRMKNNKQFQQRHAENRMPVLKFSLQGELLEKFKSLKEAYKSSEEYSKSGVHHCCTGRLNTYKGYFWIYEETYTDEGLQARINKTKKTQSIRVSQFDLKGNLIKTHESMGRAGKEISINTGSISQCCSGKMKHAGGYKWEYAD